MDDPINCDQYERFLEQVESILEPLCQLGHISGYSGAAINLPVNDGFRLPAHSPTSDQDHGVPADCLDIIPEKNQEIPRTTRFLNDTFLFVRHSNGPRAAR